MTRSIRTREKNGLNGTRAGFHGWSVLLFSIGGFLLCAGCGQRASSAQPPRPPEVEVATVVQKDVRISSEWVATLDGYVNAQIQPQVTGYLIKQDYREGSFVHKDDVLFEIDPRPFQAVLDQAKAQLAQAEAQLGNATLNVKRDIPEAQASAIPQSQLESDQQTQLAGKATVEAGQAAVEQASLNLGFTKVRSLIGGIAGIAQLQVGNLVTPTTVLTSVSQVNPIKVYFPISGDEYLRIAGKINPDTVNLLSDSSPISLQLILSNGSTYAHSGKILFADRQVDQQTGTIRIAGAFPNPGNILRPGQYGRVRAVTQVQKGALLVPQRAVTELQGSDEVAVVGPGNKITIRTVQTGERVDTMWIIDKGLNAGDRVVAEGTQKVKDGSVVTPVPFNPGSGGQ
ncbi:MAG: efflux RND transporter periplasmic adaptor subunit [Candidatus Acidiferrales bacterium]